MGTAEQPSEIAAQIAKDNGCGQEGHFALEACRGSASPSAEEESQESEVAPEIARATLAYAFLMDRMGTDST